MTLAQIGQLLLRVVSAMQTVLSVLGIIQGTVVKSAQENVPFSIDTNTSITKEVVTDAGFGLAAIKAAIDSLHSDMDAAFLTLDAAVSTVQQTGLPVTLPTVPPTGYGGGTGATAAEVWGYTLAGSGHTAGDQQDNAGNLATNFAVGGIAFPTINSSWFTLSGTWWSANAPDSPSSAPLWTDSDILSDDTLLTFLERISGYTGWTLDANDHATVAQDVAFNDFFYTSTIDALQFEQLRDFKFATIHSTVPPIWPGTDDVTFGTPVALSDTFTIGVPMDGVIVEITSVPSNTSFFNFDGNFSYRYIGALAFYDNDGEYETPQNLGFKFAVYCPKAMSLADGVSVRVKPGVTGTMTPWTINS